MVWERVLTEEERTYLYNGGAGRTYTSLLPETGGGGAFGGAFPIIRKRLRPRVFAPGIAR